ncbi:MAG TPA: DNA oxidative demethylase AlkB [Stellaceae bacterium]|nr:DNA oxidative demethylase AlkB [Stellaceae bacterium]
MRPLFTFASSIESLEPGAVLLRGFVRAEAGTLIEEIERIAQAAPFRNMATPGGFHMSVAMTNCGQFGWITDRKGYRYAAADPESGRAWPDMPRAFRDLAARAAATAGFADFAPDSCLINRYVAGARMSLHQDKDEADFASPIVSVSLGLPATFLWGGAKRNDKPRRIRLESGDVVVWGGPARLHFHGVDTLAAGDEGCRYNLTFRKAK